MFKQLAYTFLVATLAVVLNNKLFGTVPIEPLPNRHIQGTVVAFHENEYQRHAIELLTQRGQLESWACLYTLWTRESNWNPKSLNRKSGAYGIAQFMPKTWALVGAKKTSNGFKQVEAGLLYIDRKYGGNICKALGSNLGRGWY